MVPSILVSVPLPRSIEFRVHKEALIHQTSKA